MRTRTLALAAAVVAAGAVAAVGQSFAGPASHQPAARADAIHFNLVRSTGAVTAGCLDGARARVTITPQEQVEVMTIQAHHLPPRREFDLFVLQQPDAPFGDAWYQGDLRTDKDGNGFGRYVGRFSTETFIVAPGSLPAPVVHSGAFPDANTNPTSAPVHTFHLGLWFGSPRAAAAAGCPNTVTPFNGEHNAGIQALSTRQFPDLEGPLSQLD